MVKKKFYITTAIDYTNDVVHIGHSYQKILADCIARYHRLIGDDTYFLTGTDEHGQKVERSALEKGINPKTYVDNISTQNKKEWKSLNISYDRFIRTTDEDHKKFAQDFYLKSKANGDIYLTKYEGLYCEGCEVFLTESEAVNGKCPFHPQRTPLKVKEENYFFRLSKYQRFLEEFIENNKKSVLPESKRREVLSFVKEGLKDFSVSRKNVKWGIPVPDDPQHTIYVWFDALINYLTYAVQKNCWPADVHVLGKDNQRFHAIYWPAMLKSAGYDLPKTILVHDFISLNGQKISKSVGNVIKPSELVEKFTTDGVRYLLLRYGPLTSDVDLNLDRLTEVYNADLANGLGNLVARVAKMAENSGLKTDSTNTVVDSKIVENMDDFQVNSALEIIWEKIRHIDVFINKNEVWKLTGKEADKTLNTLVGQIREIAYNLKPFLPETAEKIEKQFKGPEIKAADPLFPRLK